jgi:transcriptional regulator with XRE-family HTH domain
MRRNTQLLLAFRFAKLAKFLTGWILVRQMDLDFKRIREARKRAKLSQTELGAAAGVSASQICRFEKGERRPRYEEAVRIAARLRLNVAEIVTVENLADLDDPPLVLQRKRKFRSVTQLPEGWAIVEYPETLSQHSRKALSGWLELIARLLEEE